VLKLVAVRAAGELARYGGDEFVVLLPQTKAQKALPVAEHIRESAAGLRQGSISDQGPCKKWPKRSAQHIISSRYLVHATVLIR
jgi:GGDEF domain-containing protein